MLSAHPQLQLAAVLTPGKGQAPCSPSSRQAALRVAPRGGLRPPSPVFRAAACQWQGRDEEQGHQVEPRTGVSKALGSPWSSSAQRTAFGC